MRHFCFISCCIWINSPLFAAVVKIFKEFCLYVKPKGRTGRGGKRSHILTSAALMASVFMLYFIAPFRMHSEASARWQIVVILRSPARLRECKATFPCRASPGALPPPTLSPPRQIYYPRIPPAQHHTALAAIYSTNILITPCTSLYHPVQSESTERRADASFFF